MFKRMYTDEPDQWETVEEDVMRHSLASYYNNVDDVVAAIKDGATVRTPWAFFKWEEQS